MKQDSIILRRKVRSNFTTLDNTLIRDNRLSWKALGILTYLLSLPPDFKLYLKMLSSLRPSGRDSTRTGLAELQEFGYLKIEKNRNELGRYLGNVWEVTDMPFCYINQHSNPETENPYTDNPTSDNPTLLSTNTNKELNIQNTTTTKWKFISQLSQLETKIIFNLLGDIDENDHVVLLDELEGALGQRLIKTTPIQWFRGVIKKYKNKTFMPSAGIAVGVKRDLEKSEAFGKSKQHKPSSPEVARENLAKIQTMLRPRKKNN